GRVLLLVGQRLGQEGDAAAGAEARRLGVARVALGADQREGARVADHGRPAVRAGVGVVGQERAAGAAALDARVLAAQRLVLHRLSAAAVEDGRVDRAHVVLRVAALAGNETHGPSAADRLAVGSALPGGFFTGACSAAGQRGPAALLAREGGRLLERLLEALQQPPRLVHRQLLALEQAVDRALPLGDQRVAVVLDVLEDLAHAV